jgi:hypothetical protein
LFCCRSENDEEFAWADVSSEKKKKMKAIDSSLTAVRTDGSMGDEIIR